MTRVVFIAGISGVGKSTLLNSLATIAPFQHLQASKIIYDELRRDGGSAPSHDVLRDADIDANQLALIRGFHRLRDRGANTVIVDGHNVIDTPMGLVPISPKVFMALGLQHIIFLEDEPSEIAKRRAADSERRRPVRSVEELAMHQRVAVDHCGLIATTLAIPLSLMRPDSKEDILRLLI